MLAWACDGLMRPHRRGEGMGARQALLNAGHASRLWTVPGVPVQAHAARCCAGMLPPRSAFHASAQFRFPSSLHDCRWTRLRAHKLNNNVMLHAVFQPCTLAIIQLPKSASVCTRRCSAAWRLRDVKCAPHRPGLGGQSAHADH